MNEIGVIREQIRSLVDPLLIRLRQDLYGSGITYGKYLSTSTLPPSVVIVDEGGDIPTVDTAGFIKGITTLSGSTTIGTNQKKLKFIGPLVQSTSDTTTVFIMNSGNYYTISDVNGLLAGKLTDPLTTNGDLLARLAGTTTRLPIGSSGDILTVSAGIPTWIPSSSLVDSGSIHGPFVASRFTTPSSADGVITVFALPENAVTGSVQVAVRTNNLVYVTSGLLLYGLLDHDDYTEDVISTDIISPSYAPTINPAASIFSPSSDTSHLNNNSSDYIGWDVYTNVDVTYDFTVVKNIVKATVTANTAGGWSGPKHVIWKYSDDNSTFFEALSSICVSDGNGVKSTFSWDSVGSHRYWRLHVTDSWVGGAGFTIAIQEIEMMEQSDTCSSVTFALPPASGTKVLVSYQRYDP